MADEERATGRGTDGSKHSCCSSSHALGNLFIIIDYCYTHSRKDFACQLEEFMTTMTTIMKSTIGCVNTHSVDLLMHTQWGSTVVCGQAFLSFHGVNFNSPRTRTNIKMKKLRKLREHIGLSWNLVKKNIRYALSY